VCHNDAEVQLMAISRPALGPGYLCMNSRSVNCSLVYLLDGEHVSNNKMSRFNLTYDKEHWNAGKRPASSPQKIHFLPSNRKIQENAFMATSMLIGPTALTTGDPQVSSLPMQASA
jgi:hypothetical protein